jgi:hypothetical protein
MNWKELSQELAKLDLSRPATLGRMNPSPTPSIPAIKYRPKVGHLQAV